MIHAGALKKSRLWVPEQLGRSERVTVIVGSGGGYQRR
jgi:hypothetical protein